MKLIARTMGGFLVAALAVVLVILATSGTLIPQLSQYISNTFPAEKNLEFISTVAVDPEPGHLTPADGEIYETNQYIYVYDATVEGWKVSVKDKTLTKYPSLFETIYSKPLVDMNSTFKGCESMIQAPAVPEGVKNLTSTFEGCAALTGTLVVFAEPDVYDNCFTNTVQTLTLTGSSSALSELSLTSIIGNVVIK